MRIGDLVVGEEYEYRDYSSPLRAKVLEKGVQLRYYTHVGVRIQIAASGLIKNVPARVIRRPWAEAEAENKVKAREAKERYARRQDFVAQKDRLAVLLVMLEIQDDVKLAIGHYDNNLHLTFDTAGAAKTMVDAFVARLEYTCQKCQGVDCVRTERADYLQGGVDVIKCKDCDHVFYVHPGTNWWADVRQAND